MTDVVKAVEKNELFKGISPEDLEKMLVCSKSVYKRYSKGQVIFHKDEPSKNIYVLLKGKVSAEKNFASGKKNIIYEIDEGNVFGEHAFFGDGHVYHYDAVASSDIEALGIKWDFFYCFCNSACPHHSRLIQNMLEIISMKEWMAIKKLNIVSTTSLRERLSTWLIDEAGSGYTVKLTMNREELSEYLGVARPSLSRALMRLKDEGLIEVSRNEIKILNKNEIEKICN